MSRKEESRQNKQIVLVGCEIGKFAGSEKCPPEELNICAEKALLVLEFEPTNSRSVLWGGKGKKSLHVTAPER